MGKKYSYFISYDFQDKLDAGVGNLELKTDEKIKCYKDIMDLTDMIKEHTGYRDIIINNYILLDN